LQFQITYGQEPTTSRFDRCRRARARQHGAREPRPQRGPVNSELALARALAWSALRFRTAGVFVVPCGLVCVVVADVPRRRVSTGPALACLTRRRYRTALFALRATATLDPFFRCAVVLQNEGSQPLIALSYTAAAASAVGVEVASKDRNLPFDVRCPFRCRASFLSRGLVLCLRRAGKAPVLCAAVCCVPSASALGSGHGGAARGLEVRGPVLQHQVGGLGAGFAVEDKAQWRRGCDGPAWCPPGSCAGRAPLAANDGRERRAVQCSRAISSAYAALLVSFDWPACFVYLKGKRTGEKGAL